MNVIPDPIALRRFSVDEYHRLADSGVLGEEERVELLEGILFEKYAGRERRFTVAEYYQLAELGILGPERRVELIDGVIYAMSPIGSRHSGVVSFLDTELKQRLGPRAIVRVQGPIRLHTTSEPEPDLAVVRPRADFYRGDHPRPADVLLVIEVMETSAAYDRGIKLAAYALAGIPEVWLVDLNGGWIEVHRHPVDGVYTESRAVRPGSSVSPEAFPDAALDIDSILG